MIHNSGPIPAPGKAIDVVPVTQEIVIRLWERSWRRDHPELDHDAVRQSVDRAPIADAVLHVIYLVVLDGCGEPIASTQLRIDGVTATIEEVMTDPAHRRVGLARALVLDVLVRARTAGCDVVFLVPRRSRPRLTLSLVSPARVRRYRLAIRGDPLDCR